MAIYLIGETRRALGPVVRRSHQNLQSRHLLSFGLAMSAGLPVALQFMRETHVRFVENSLLPLCFCAAVPFAVALVH
ncbi:hypothetical protein BKA66DRAFT_290008 [Pyrenochaeta sp. MPI-SDFR-AT-0127]|nr:hypothetical protein BKA66DRAFT_290008 [Pyrenochaeta sp. MPI-SDFR-AT-0127]